jgi:hypothetical protein
MFLNYRFSSLKDRNVNVVHVFYRDNHAQRKKISAFWRGVSDIIVE